MLSCSLLNQGGSFSFSRLVTVQSTAVTETPFPTGTSNGIMKLCIKILIKIIDGRLDGRSNDRHLSRSRHYRRRWLGGMKKKTVTKRCCTGSLHMRRRNRGEGIQEETVFGCAAFFSHGTARSSSTDESAQCRQQYKKSIASSRRQEHLQQLEHLLEH